MDRHALERLFRRVAGWLTIPVTAVRPGFAKGGLSLTARRRVRALMDARLQTEGCSPLPLGELARTAGLSVHHFIKAFRQTEGGTPHAQVLARRLDLALSLLLQPDARVDWITNALGPMRVIEALQDLVPATGVIGVMSSGQGSIGTNEKGGREVYRGSKAALNQFVRSFAAREPETTRTLVLMTPGWVRTDLGGPDARLSIEESVPNLVNVLLARRGTPGLQYLDYLDRIVPR